ncbi:MAG: hypothetical protein ACLGIR_01565 [Actinomycetes bacterium]
MAGHGRMAALAVAVALPALVGVVPAGQVPDDACGSDLQAVLDLGDQVLCTHGDDADGDAFTAAAASGGTRTAGALPTAPIACETDGIDGHRVQVLYVHAAGTPDRRASLAGSIDRWAGQVAWTFRASAERRGATSTVRFVTTRASRGCRLDVRSVSVPKDAIGDFSRTVGALRTAGWAESGRTYLLFVDHDRYCGLATAPRDDRKVSTNAANVQVGYARVDRRCWDTGDRGFHSIAAHELTHTLGAVQASAPGATRGGHCTTEWDLLCYADEAGVRVQVRCQDRNSRTSGAGDHSDRLLDCTGDTYFHPAPRRGSYLASHWNVADHRALQARAGRGAGHVGNNPAVPRDPRGRTQTWSNDTLGGAHQPLLPAAHGFEACIPPIEIRVPEQTTSGLVDGTVALVDELASGPAPDAVLDAALPAVVDRINAAVGRTVLRYSGTIAKGARSDGQVDLAWGQTAALADAQVTVRDVRIRSAAVRLDRARVEQAEAAGRQTFVTHALALALGVGRVDVASDVMAALPRPGASDAVALRALRHLYRSCDVDPRLSSVGPAAAVDPTEALETTVGTTPDAGQAPVVETQPDDAPDAAPSAGADADPAPASAADAGADGTQAATADEPAVEQDAPVRAATSEVTHPWFHDAETVASGRVLRDAVLPAGSGPERTLRWVALALVLAAGVLSAREIRFGGVSRGTEGVTRTD